MEDLEDNFPLGSSKVYVPVLTPDSSFSPAAGLRVLKVSKAFSS